MNERIQAAIDAFRANPCDDRMHGLIEIGRDVLPSLLAAWRGEKNLEVRNRLFEVLSEMPAEETVPVFQEKLSSPDSDEVRFATLGLLRFDALRYETEILKAIRSHPTLSNDKPFFDYINSGLKGEKRRRG